MDLRGRNALVTGAGIRIGRAIALGLVGRGANVGVHYFRSEDGARATAAEAEKAGARVALLRADLADAADAEALAARASSALGGLDIVVSGAAVMERRPLGDVTAADWDRTINLNLRGAFFVAKGAAAVMADRGGAIVTIADIAAFERWRQYPVHCISKAGVVAMTELLAKALAPGIRVNAVAPGAVLPPDAWDAETRARLAASTPVGRLGSAADVVRAVIFLLENDYVTGETLVVDGGRRIR
ncbi:MAG: SDR family oxidoreductase [Gemmatimonadetes bacterium]|nr:SDR family oxidoreductase [Gemmatimonadota bacterium]